ncbi:uroporphyrinogen-III C-methyltransferase [Planctobacterium marinum]|uniref:uroporphyrinogen-III C-methyltransferase n=1 Tax=Planctobacterium marinum TaxID=1631968 RepID=UPI001E2E47E1|nr:uroporphyrinogen-III C-methyltransferase [Planctobacterium marinum]MCC2606509.1 uroporphyrinogen-III C-methyltransferase [Planctobacterium marinum]
MTNSEKNTNGATSVQPDNKEQSAETAQIPSASPATAEQTSQYKPSPANSRKSQRKITRPQKTEVARPARRTNPAIWFLVLLNTLLIAALSGGAWWGWTQWQQLQSVQDEQAQQRSVFRQQLETEFSDKTRSVQQATEAELAQTRQALSALEQQVSNTVTTLKADVAEQLAGAEQDLDLSEISYLIRMAARKANVEKDIASALALLREVEAVLLRKADQNLLPLREMLAADIRALRELEQDKPETMAFVIGAMLQRVPELTFPTPEAHFSAEPLQPSDDTAQWWSNLKILWQNLVDDFLTIEKLEQPLTPYLSVQQQALTRASLNYQMLTMRHAVLQRDEALYQQALQQAQSTLMEFDHQGQVFNTLQQDLAELARQPFPKVVTMSFMSVRYVNEHLVGER